MQYWSNLARSVTAYTDTQQFELDLNAQSIDLLAELTDLFCGALKREKETEGYGGYRKKQTRAAGGRCEEMQQLCDSGKGNE